jgi:hypothetical protein
MSVDTKINVVRKHEIDNFMLNLTKCLKETFKEKFIYDSVQIKDHESSYGIFKSYCFTLDYKNSSFSNNKENRVLNIFYYKEEFRCNFYELSIGAWGHNKEIANSIVEHFGGFVDYSDCDNSFFDYCVSELNSHIGVKS